MFAFTDGVRVSPLPYSIGQVRGTSFMTKVEIPSSDVSLVLLQRLYGSEERSDARPITRQGFGTARPRMDSD